MAHSILTQKKAKEIMRHGSVHGKSLTKKQKGFFGARAGGTPVKRKKSLITSGKHK